MLLVWWTSLAMCAGSALAVAWLVLARELSEHRLAARFALQAALRDALLAHLGGAELAAESVRRWRGRDVLAAEVLLQYVALIGGPERSALVQVVSAAGLDAAFRRRAERRGKAGRLACLEALGCFTDTASIEVLGRSTMDPDADIRLAGWRALRSAGVPIAVSDLIDEAGFSDPAAPLSYCEFFQQVAESDPAGAIAALGDPQRPGVIRRRLIMAVGRTGSGRGASLLLRLASDPDPAIRAEALRAMAGQAHAVPVPLLMQAMLADAWEVRAEAVSALNYADGRAALPLAATLLDDASWRVRQKAAEALVASGEDGLHRLRTAAEVGSSRARLAASLALADRAAA